MSIDLRNCKEGDVLLLSNRDTCTFYSYDAATLGLVTKEPRLGPTGIETLSDLWHHWPDGLMAFATFPSNHVIAVNPDEVLLLKAKLWRRNNANIELASKIKQLFDQYPGISIKEALLNTGFDLNNLDEEPWDVLERAKKAETK